jgi:uncharacterized membrane protein YphA (DoxX/SURF4 family)
MDTRLQHSTVALRVAVGLMATLAGLDKFFNILADWSSYISPIAAQIVPLSPDVLMMIVGVVEMAVGVCILTALPALGAYVASAWLMLVAGNLLLGGHFDVAVRDVVLAVAAFTLARLIENGAEADARQPSPLEAARHATA